MVDQPTRLTWTVASAQGTSSPSIQTYLPKLDSATIPLLRPVAGPVSGGRTRHYTDRALLRRRAAGEDQADRGGGEEFDPVDRFEAGLAEPADVGREGVDLAVGGPP